ncbi:MAG: zinc ribbon domain-containing protein [Spirochaetia bacterium]|jgi:uncharacterized protein|nr:zinc ribbon domain-containing protein [Spirochaetia bacterium]
MAHNWTCPKCGNNGYETDRFAATGGGLSKLFDVQNKRFNTISCTNCGYTEIYKTTTSGVENILDLFMS